MFILSRLGLHNYVVDVQRHIPFLGAQRFETMQVSEENLTISDQFFLKINWTTQSSVISYVYNGHCEIATEDSRSLVCVQRMLMLKLCQSLGFPNH